MAQLLLSGPGRLGSVGMLSETHKNTHMGKYTSVYTHVHRHKLVLTYSIYIISVLQSRNPEIVQYGIMMGQLSNKLLYVEWSKHLITLVSIFCVYSIIWPQRLVGVCKPAKSFV